jgi:hypothetical protein
LYILKGSITKFPSATNLGMPPTTPIVLKNTWHMCKRLNVFSLLIDATNKNNKVFVEVIDITNVT